MTTHNDDAVREVTRQQRAERRNATRAPRNDKPTAADLTRELHLMETQVAEHGYPGTRAVLALIGDLRKEVYALKRERDAAHEAIDAALATTWVADDDGGWGDSEDTLYPDRLSALAALQPHWYSCADQAWGVAGAAEDQVRKLKAALAEVDVTPDPPPTNSAP